MMTSIVNYKVPKHTLCKSIEEVGDLLIKIFEQLLEKNKTISIALSGGNTPKELFIYWAKYKSNELIWNKIKYFWVDERAVPPDDEESNFGVAKALFFEPLHIPNSHIFRMRGEKNVEIEANRYSGVLLDNVKTKNKLPIFDVILLGIGDDGHTASIFPGNEFLFSSKEICKDTSNPYTKQKRITITGNVINNANNVIIIALGSSKREILKNVFSQTEIKYPVQFVNPVSENFELITDFSLS